MTPVSVGMTVIESLERGDLQLTYLSVCRSLLTFSYHLSSLLVDTSKLSSSDDQPFVTIFFFLFSPLSVVKKKQMVVCDFISLDQGYQLPTKKFSFKLFIKVFSI